MLEFFILALIWHILTIITIPGSKADTEDFNYYDNNTSDAYVKNHSWEFKSVDDAMDFRELRKQGWRGNAEDFYKWKEEE